MNACDAVQELLSAHALEALGSTEETLVQDHLGDCGDCRVAKDETVSFLSLIEAPPIKAPDEVWSKIRSRIDREHAGDPVRDSEPSPVISLGCSFCRGVLERGLAVYCASCLAPHHPECFEEHGRCSVMGCGEHNIVRSQEPPRLQLTRTKRPRRSIRRWLSGGLATVVMAGAGVAALVDDTQVVRPQWEIRPAGLLADYRLEVHEATLGEVVAELKKLPGAPSITISSGCENLLIRRARFEGRHWSQSLQEVCADLGLSANQVPATRKTKAGWSISKPKRFDPDAHDQAKGNRLRVDTTHVLSLLRGGGEPRRVHRGWEQTVLVAPKAAAFAIRSPSSLVVISNGETVASQAFEAPISDVEWSTDGRRLAYVAGRGDDGVLGLFDLTTRPVAHIVDDSFPGLDDRAELAWCMGSEQFLLKTRADLKLIDTRLGGQAITLTTPAPEGEGRFDVVALDGDRYGNRFMVLYSDGIEVWGTEKLSSRAIVPRMVFLHYEVSEPVARGRYVVVKSQSQNETWAVRFDTLNGGSEKLEVRNGAESPTFDVALDADGEQVATLQWDADTGQDELYVRRVDGSGELKSVKPISDDVVRGFAWGPDGSALAFWTDSGCHLHTFSGAPTEVQRFNDATITDVQWLGSSGLVITTRSLETRKAEVVLEEQR